MPRTLPERPRYLRAAALVGLGALPAACAVVGGTGPGDATLLGAGLVGLAGLTGASERWRRRSMGDAPIPPAADPREAP